MEMNEEKIVELNGNELSEVLGGSDQQSKSECPIYRTSMKCPERCNYPTIKSGQDEFYYCPYEE